MFVSDYVEHNVKQDHNLSKTFYSNIFRVKLKIDLATIVPSLKYNIYSPADKKYYCDRVDQSMKLGMQVRFGIYNSIRRGAKKNCLIKTNF